VDGTDDVSLRRLGRDDHQPRDDAETAETREDAANNGHPNNLGEIAR
jgi:hypothetical protein